MIKGSKIFPEFQIQKNNWQGSLVVRQVERFDGMFSERVHFFITQWTEEP